MFTAALFTTVKTWKQAKCPSADNRFKKTCYISIYMCSVQFSHSVVSDSWRPHGLQHASLPCPSPTPRAYSNSCPSSRWCYPGISSSVAPLLLLPSIFPSIRVFSNESVLHICVDTHTYSGILFSRKKESNIAIYIGVDDARDDHGKWSKSKTNVIRYHICVKSK